ncbi:sialate O-acetylesterase [Candidatus Latescibacterota bacterium]
MTLLWAFPLAADITLPSVIGENMVIQRDADICLWGWADPGENITVSVDTMSIAVKADSNGEWKVVCGPLKPGGPIDVTFTGKNTISLSNVLVGDVWVCSGQSNMEMRVRHCIHADREVADALHRNLRLFQIRNDLSPEPGKDCDGRWDVCRPSTVGLFSAAGYYFGRKIMQDIDIPVGLVNASWGGTTVETWMSAGAGKHCPEFRTIQTKWEPALTGKPHEILAFYRTMALWEEDVHHVLYTGKPVLPFYATPPESPVKLAFMPHMPSWVFNAMIAPIVPFHIKGVVWYQGESNSGKAYQYRSLFPALIADWRSLWGNHSMPFLYVQLANFGERDPSPVESSWAELREAQLLTLSIPNTAMAVAIDIGESDNIHPRNKQEVGRRLALGALKTAYDRDIVHSGPLYHSMRIDGNRIRLGFTRVGSGLTSKDNGPLIGFAVAGKDRRFVWAQAKIEGDEVIAWSNDVPYPVAVRYGWSNNPFCTLFNKEELPASPFRTDTWLGITEGAN